MRYWVQIMLLSFAPPDDKIDDNTCGQRESAMDNRHREMLKYSAVADYHER
jgi:hypothetical protein